MKKLLIASLIVMAISVLADPPHSDTVTTSSIKIIPQQGIKSAPAWVGGTNTYAQGEVVQNNYAYYMAIIGGISTNLGPIHSMGQGDQKRDGVTWRAFRQRERNGLAVINTSTNDMWLSLDYDAVAGSGIALLAQNTGFALGSSFQGSVHIISTNSATASSTTW